MLLYKSARNLKFPLFTFLINAHCHNPITVLRGLKMFIKQHICYFYIPWAKDKKATRKSLHMPKVGQGSIGEGRRACRTMNTPQHGQLGLGMWTGRTGGKPQEKGEVNWLEAIPLCRGVWRAMEDLRRYPIQHPIKEFDQTPPSNHQGALSVPHRGLTLEDFCVCFQMVVMVIQHLFNPQLHRSCITMPSRSFCPCPDNN